MYSEEELKAAVDAGVMTDNHARAFRGFVEEYRKGTIADEEQFRFITSFNDIFVTIGIALVLVPIIFLTLDWGGFLIGAVASWLLAEFFTRRRRMSLPSIALLISFVLNVFFLIEVLVFENVDPGFPAHSRPEEAVGTLVSLFLALPGAAALLASLAHWWRFKVPITVAAGMASFSTIVISLALYSIPEAQNHLGSIIFVLGLLTFALAMFWDMKDTARATRRSDVAFWLHLTAAPMLVHPVFFNLAGQASVVEVIWVLGIYAVLVVLALVIDRRAMLVSAAGYVLYALGSVLQSGASNSGISFFLAALLLGSILLLFSVFWTTVRRPLVGMLPSDLRRRLPDIS